MRKFDLTLLLFSIHSTAVCTILHLVQIPSLLVSSWLASLQPTLCLSIWFTHEKSILYYLNVCLTFTSQN